VDHRDQHQLALDGQAKREDGFEIRSHAAPPRSPRARRR
jgi:hypothetical protein